MSIQSKQMFYVMLAFVVLLIIAAGALTKFGLSVLQTKGDELTNLKEKQLVVKQREAALTRAKQDIKDYAELESISKAIVPQEKDQARTVREIVTIAQEAGIPIESIRFPSSSLGALKKSSSKTKKTNNPETTQLTPVPGTKGLYAMDITVQSSSGSPVPYSRLLLFLQKLEQNRRTAHVTNISITPSEGNRNFVTFTINLNVYIKP